MPSVTESGTLAGSPPCVAAGEAVILRRTGRCAGGEPERTRPLRRPPVSQDTSRIRRVERALCFGGRPGSAVGPRRSPLEGSVEGPPEPGRPLLLVWRGVGASGRGLGSTLV